MTNFLPLVEQFHSLQGEGYHAGKSAFFVRLAGCKVGCSWCDTKNSWDEKKHPSISIEKIIDQIKKETLKQYQLSKSEDGLKKEDKIFYLQPAWNNANGFSLAIDFVKNNPDWKLSLQTHKYLKIN